jgi:glycosyltransferase involved in cell wall biosynthesis
MKVLHLISSGGMYGAESVVATLASNLQNRGEDTIVGVFDNAHRPKNDASDRIEKAGVKVIRIPCSGRADGLTVRAIRKLIRTEQIDILHSHGYKADIYGYLATRRLRIPIIATRHNQRGLRHTLAIRLYEFLDILFLRRFNAVAAVSDLIAEELLRAGVAPRKVTVIGNGIDVSRFVGASPTLSEELNKEQRLLIGTAGRLIPQKGIEYFLMAASEVLKTFPTLLFGIVGEGPHRPALERSMKDLGIERNVVFTGPRSDMPNIYASFDVFVLPSLEEGMPMTVLEALASGLPVIATKVGAVEKLVFPNQTGILVQPGEAAGLAAALISLIGNPELRVRLGQNGRSLVQNEHSSSVMSQRYLRLYQELLNEKAQVQKPISVSDLTI